jgi:hypothetical protein
VFDIWRLGYELGTLCNHFQSGRGALDGRGHKGTRGALRATRRTIAHRPNDEMGAERIWAEEIRLTRGREAIRLTASSTVIRRGSKKRAPGLW